MIRAILIDDETHALETLKWKLQNYCPSVSIQAMFHKPEEGLSYLTSNSVDLIFLDIEMPGMNGFDLLQKLTKFDFDVIFTTAYDEYGIKAIKYSALDYLLKPIQVEELTKAVTKYQEKQMPNVLPKQLEVLFERLKPSDVKNQKIALSTKESIELVSPRDIIVCESDNNYTMVYLEEKRKLISKSLKEFEELLVPHNFFRTHQSYLINLDKMVEYVRAYGGYLVMRNGMQIPVSRSKKESLMKFF